MKILIIGDCGHQLLTAFIRSIKKYTNIEFDAFSISKIKEEDSNYYRSIHYAKSFGKAYDYKKLRKIIYGIEIVSRFNKLKTKYDYIHIHLAKAQYLFIWPFVKLRSNKVAVTIWGSEFLRANKRKRFVLGFMYKRADILHCTNKELRISIIEYYKISPEKVVAVPMFLENLSKIDNTNANQYEIKKEFGWDSTKLQIVIGYNYNEGQQHLTIIDEFLRLDQNILNKVELVFPITYGTNKDYQKKIISKANKVNCKSFFYTSFLSDVEVNKIRKAGDIFINLQITDQYSATFVESLFAGNIVITGSWLKYDQLKEAGVYFIEIGAISEINSCLKYILENHENILGKVQQNKGLIRELFDEERLANMWIELYGLAPNK